MCCYKHKLCCAAERGASGPHFMITTYTVRGGPCSSHPLITQSTELFSSKLINTGPGPPLSYPTCADHSGSVAFVQTLRLNIKQHLTDEASRNLPWPVLISLCSFMCSLSLNLQHGNIQSHTIASNLWLTDFSNWFKNSLYIFNKFSIICIY